MNDNCTPNRSRCWLVIAALLMLVSYVVSYGPVYRLALEGYLPATARRVYEPIVWAAVYSPGPVSDALLWSYRYLLPEPQAISGW